MKSLIGVFILIIISLLLHPSIAKDLRHAFAVNNETQIEINNVGLQTNHTAVTNKTQYQISFFGFRRNHPGYVDCLFKPPSAGCPSQPAECYTNCKNCLRGFADINSACYSASTGNTACLCNARTSRGVAVLHLILSDPWNIDQSFSSEDDSDLKQLLEMALQFIEERLSEEADLKELFKMMDADNIGTITFEEWKDDLKRFASALAELKN